MRRSVCKNCRYFHKHPNAPDNRCRKNAPIFRIDNSGIQRAAFPSVNDYDWCGDFAFKPDHLFQEAKAND